MSSSVHLSKSVTAIDNLSMRSRMNLKYGHNKSVCTVKTGSLCYFHLLLAESYVCRVDWGRLRQLGIQTRLYKKDKVHGNKIGRWQNAVWIWYMSTALYNDNAYWKSKCGIIKTLSATKKRLPRNAMVRSIYVWVIHFDYL